MCSVRGKYSVKRLLCCPLLFFLFSPLAFAGELVLYNGDRLAGEFVRIQGEALVWNSDNFGEIQVPTSKVDSVQTGIAMKLDGHEQPCYWVSVAEGHVRFDCVDGDSDEVHIMSLNMVIPHQEYAGGHYNYRGKLSASGRRSAGNKDEEIWAVDSETLFRRGDHRHEVQVEYDSLSKNESETESRGRVRYSLDWFFEEKWFWYNNIRFGFDEPANIQESYVYGTGLGYQVWETSISALSLETGADFVKELFEEPESPTPDFLSENRTAAWRWALDFRYLLPRSAGLFHRHQLIQSLEETEDWLLETETGISMPLTGQLFTEIKAEYDVDNQPAEGGVREDKQITVGVGYSW
jgi:putative salt-induced outer membrane protein YdiY